MAKNIVLIGFMGTGKTTVGLRLAENLRRSFVDMDREIETLNKMTVADMFRQYGEVRFRSEESLMASKLGKAEDLVIATGGGTVLRAENIVALKENGILVCLDARPGDIYTRVSRKRGSRPLLQKEFGVSDIEQLLQSREPYYANADLRIGTSGKRLNEVVDEILCNLREMGELTSSSEEADEISRREQG